MNKSHSMTEAQRLEVRMLKAQGFSVHEEEATVVVMRKGNDWRLVQQDGKQKRALGARR